MAGRAATDPLNGDVRLRDVTESDLAAFYEHQRDPDAARMAAFPSRERDTFLAHWTRILGDPTILKKTVLVGGRVAGNVVSFEGSDRREVGYWIGKAFWNRGVATAALSAFLRHETTRPLYAGVAKHNAASRRVLEKCGFTIRGEEQAFSESGDNETVEGFLLELRAGETEQRSSIVTTGFEIAGVNRPARVVFALSDQEGSLQVTLGYDGSSATWPVPAEPGDAEDFAAFFADLAREAGGWEGEKTVSTWRGDELVLRCHSGEGNDRREVWLYVTLASDFQDPYWAATLRLEIRAESLPDLATRAADFFTALKSHLDREAA